MPKLGQKHHVLSIQEKLDIVRAIESGTKKSALARQRNLPLTTVCGIWNAKAKLLGSAAATAKRCRLRGSTFPDVEEALVKWLKAARSKNLPVSGPLLVEKALVFASQLKHDDFVCSNGWLARFKARHGINMRAVSGEGAAADVNGAEQWQNGQLRQILTDYAPDNIFNMDESALFFKLLPDRTLAFKGETCTGGKHAKDRISVAFAVNMSGNEKLPLLVIGKSAKPRCFKGARLPSGVVYRSNTKAWMTAKLFEEYVRLIDRRFAAKNRRVALLLDNASAHIVLDNLAAVKLVFLPPNTTAIAQPLDQGVIRAVKQLYKKNLLRRILLAFECGKVFSIDLLGAIHLLEYSWRQVETTTVQNCFKRAGFTVCTADAEDASDTADQTADTVDQACETLLAEVLERQGVVAEGISFTDFRDTDSEVQTSPDMSDEAIVASVVAEVSPNDSDGDDAESDSMADSGPTVAEAARYVSLMRVFAEKRGLAEKVARSLSEFEAAVVAARPPRHQTKITDFCRAK